MTGKTSQWAFHSTIQYVYLRNLYIGIYCIIGPVLGSGDSNVNPMQSLGPLEDHCFVLFSLRAAFILLVCDIQLCYQLF